jgi:hypothetical protein
MAQSRHAAQTTHITALVMSLKDHLRQIGGIGGVSALPLIATELLSYGKRRSGPGAAAH